MKASLMDLPMYRMYLMEKTTLAESSIRVYTEAIKQFLVSNPDVDNLTAYNEFIIRTGIKKRATYYYSALRHFIKFMNFEPNLKEMLLENMLKPEIKDPITTRMYLTDDQRIGIINNLEKEKHQVIALIQNLTGARAGDVLRLKKGRLFYEEQDGKPVIRLEIIGKRKKKISTHIFDKTVQDVLVYYINQVNEKLLDDYYFLEKSDAKGRQGQFNNEDMMVKMNYQHFWADLKQASHKSGIDITQWATHDFRRCFAREIWDRYKDLQILQRALQHSNPMTTMRYLNQSGLQNKDILKEVQQKNYTSTV